MEPARALVITTLRTLQFLNRREEKRLRAILADSPKFLLKMETQSDLEKILSQAKAQAAELAKLEQDD